MSYPDRIGCDRCFQASAIEASSLRTSFREVADLVDESHFMARVLACSKCGQHCLSVFCETVDWVDSDDPSCSSLLPLTTEEANRLTALGDAFDEAALEGIGRDRRYLHVNNPKGAETTAEWLPSGFWIRPHD